MGSQFGMTTINKLGAGCVRDILEEHGRRNGYKLSGSPSYNRGWEDGFDWLNDIQHWSPQYQLRAMVPAENNQRLANSHFGI